MAEQPENPSSKHSADADLEQKDRLADLASSETLLSPDDGAKPSVEETSLERPPRPDLPSSSVPVVPPLSGQIDTWRIGQTLAGRYTLLEKLGRGGMSEVYLARHELLKKNVAVKVLRPDIAVTKASLSRFHREAMAAASIGNPHIVDITDYGFTDDGNAFIVMERLEGADLRTVIKHFGALPSGRCVAIIRQVLRGLSAAHVRGIVHRDLKAENVFLSELEDRGEFVKLLDFGISKVTQPIDDSPDGSVIHTSTGAVMGTPQYIAPEQAHGQRDIDHRADIYSAGVMLYEMLTGELPFSGKSAIDVVMKHLQEAPQPPKERRPDLDIPARLDRVVLKAMSKERENRYASAEEMLGALPEASGLPGGFSSTTLAAVAATRKTSYWPYAIVLVALFAIGALALLALLPAAGPTLDASPTSIPTLDSTPTKPAAVPAVARPDARPIASTVRLVLRVSQPTDAKILLDGELVGKGEVVRQVPRTSPPMVFTVSARGYRDKQVTMRTDQPSQVIKLQRIKQRRSFGKQPRRQPGKKATPTDLKPNPYPGKR